MNESLFILGLIFVFVSYMIFLTFIVKKQESRFNEKLNGIVFNIHNNRKDAESEIEKINAHINRIEKEYNYNSKLIDSRFNIIDLELYKIKNPPEYGIGKLTDNIVIISSNFRRYESELSRIIAFAQGYWEYEVFIVNLNKKMTKTNEGIKELLKEEQENK